jgi:hypothetical protein
VFQDSRSARSDFPIEKGDHQREHPVGEKVPIRDLKSILALRA